MFATYLWRELANRRRQTTIIAIGMALAIALVMVVTAVAAGVRDAQATALESVYGVGTDITVSAAPAAPGEGGGRPGQFEFGSEDGATADGSTSLSQSRLTTGFGTSTFDSSTLDTVLNTSGVSAATATLSLTNSTFSGEIPDFSQMQAPQQGGEAGGEAGGTPPSGGPDGAGGSAFDIESFTVEGVEPAATLGPLSSVTVTEGRLLESTDTDAAVAVLDSAYATSSELAVGDTLDIGGETFEIVGIVSSDSAEATTAANAYIPLAVAQQLAGLDDQVSSISVQAASSSEVDAVKSELETALPEVTVNTQSDLASTISGSLSSASTLAGSLGTWLSVLVLAAAFLIAILFTVSGVSRRTREFGTLKALGWSNRRVVGQVAGESVVQGLLGGAAGVVLGLVGILVINLVSPSLTASTTTTTGPGGMGGQGGMGGPGFGETVADTASTIALHASVTLSVILMAVALSVLGGLLAGAFGGWRAARLRPAEALRSIA